MLNSRTAVGRVGFDAVALKPREVDLASVGDLPADQVVVDFEGTSALSSPSTLRRLSDLARLRVTIPIRADGFDPLDDDRRWADVPEAADIALVAGNPAYLTDEERRRRVAPRLAAGLDRAPEAWVGTEGIERLAMATGATQFELLGPATERRIRELRRVGFDAGFAVYAPTVLTRDEDGVLEALGPYVARRRRVAAALPADARTAASATGRAREVLLDGCSRYAITGDVEAVRRRVAALRDAGVDHIVGYPPGSFEAFTGAD